MKKTSAIWFLASVSFLILASCDLQNNNQEEPYEETMETVLHDSEAREIVDTGALLPVEKLLSGGTIDIGNKNAPLTLLVFTEHHCSYCKEFNNEHLIRLITEFIKPGLLNVQLVYFPLKKYPQSMATAKAVLCASRKKKGLKMNNLLFEHSNKNQDSIKIYAKELELDIDVFEECMESSEITNIIKRQKKWAESLGVQYVPTFFLNGNKFVGLPYYADLRGRIEEEIYNLK